MLFWVLLLLSIIIGGGGLYAVTAISASGVTWFTLGWLLTNLFGLVRSYRPPENHVAAIYRRGYFRRWANPGRWTLLLRFYEQVQAEFDLGGRTAQHKFRNVLSLDHVPLDIELRVNFFVDPRQAPEGFRPRALNLPAAAWETIVINALEPILRNRVIPTYPGEYLFSARGRLRVQRALSDLLHDQLRHLGIYVNVQSGVTLGNLLPNPVYLRALQEHSAALSLGEAALARVLPLVETVQTPGELPDAWRLFVLGAAAAVNREGRLGTLALTQNGPDLHTSPGDQPRPRPPRRRPPGVNA